MASSSPFFFFYLFFSLCSLSIRSMAASCSSASFSKNRTYASCEALPHLSAAIHWTFDPANSSISLAFTAPPAASSGWIAWAINPNGVGMIGSQALIAFRHSDGALKVDTFNITSYASIKPSPIDFPSWDLEAEASSGAMVLFAKVKLPKGKTEINQVWQVGTSVTGGVPDKHAMSPENMAAKGTLNLVKGQGVSTVPTPSPAASGAHHLIFLRRRVAGLFLLALLTVFIY
ncbi:hypothetical protein J5N97_020421 [Dioscorea zingiberensis]|uniref:DOMON domain-containing protein n=1 Tax=Dioscorea zingiberensis TaxID=325984 RepID=A0A9D5CGZ9_9LILI|nr:hypothetical protein J5N97_020421 [Dioscorea zingiberensis]